MESLPIIFEQFFKDHGLQVPSGSVLAGVSGGADSMALADLLLKSGRLGAVAHVHYGLRQEALIELQLVEDWCNRNQVAFYVLNVDSHDSEGKSIQDWARQIRYDFFKKVIKGQEGLKWCALGHHGDDKAETALFRLLRSRNINPLSGIPALRDFFIRPMLGASKQQILDHCQTNAIPFREDSSNFKTDYLRNQIRHEILPTLAKLNPEAVSRINEAVDDQTRLWAWVKKKFLGYAQRCIIQQPDGVYFLPARLKKMDEDVGLQIFLGWWLQSLGLTGAEVRRACEEMNSKTGSRWLFKTGTLLKVVNGWKWAKIGTSPTAEVSISVFGEGKWSASGWEIQIGSGKCLPAWSPEEASVAWFDMDAVSWPLEIRPNKPGDRISIGSEKKGWTDVTQRIVLSQKRDIVVGSCQLLALDSRGEVVMVSDGSVAQRFKGLVGKGRIGFFACVWRGHTI